MAEAGMKFREVTRLVGGRVRQARRARRLSQAELARRLEPYVGSLWSRAAVSRAEKGLRAFQAHELLALAVVLGYPLPWFLAPQSGKSLKLGRKRVTSVVLRSVGVSSSKPGSIDPATKTFLQATSLNLVDDCVRLLERLREDSEVVAQLASDVSALGKGP
ncbi:MAG: helix-turn-helix transcriptional regulator [Actinomycetota bacterium]